MRIFKPSRRPGGRRLKGCICITIAGRTRRWDLKRQEWCMTTKRKINRSFLSPQGCAPVRYAHLHYALRGKKTKQQQPITKVPNLFQDLTPEWGRGGKCCPAEGPPVRLHYVPTRRIRLNST